MKPILPLIAAVAVLLFAAAAKANPYLVFDYKTGRVYSQNQAFDKWYPASLTKMMTAYTVFREIRKGQLTLQSPVRISEAARAKPPSKMGFPVGTILTMDAALKIILVKSANDVSHALAESAGGSEEAFVRLMNANAERLGMANTRFANPHGLHDEGQYTTARDLAILAREIYREFPRESAYFAIPAIKVGDNVMQNHNALIQRFPGTIGMKTGFVCAAGLNIVASAKLRGKTLIAVVLGGESGKARNVLAAQLLDDAARKPFAFALPKLDSLKGASRPPVNMRETVCSKRKKVTESGENEDLGEDARKARLDEMEARYLKPKGNNTRIIPVTLGNATGPDPFGLVTPLVAQGASAPSSQAMALSEEGSKVGDGNAADAAAAVVLPAAGSIPIPVPRPTR